MNIRLALVLILLACGVLDTPRPHTVSAEEPTNSPASTLQHVKAAGAERSIYRTAVPQTKPGETPTADLETFRSRIEPALKKACYECHGPDTAEADIRIDTLNPDLLHGEDVSWWLEVSSAVGNGEMPPEDAAQLTDEERQQIVEWLSAEIQTASQVRRAQHDHSSFRRMTRYEYNYALQDLLGLELDFAKDLPPDPISPDGFQNSSETLQITGKQYAEYLATNRRALDRATVSGQRPQVLYWGVSAQAASADQFAELETKDSMSDDQRQASQAQAAQPSAARQNRQRRGRRGRDGPRRKPAVYQNTETGQTVPVTWSYAGAVHAWSPVTSRPPVPDASQFIAVLPARQRMVIELGNQLPDKGIMRVRVRASRVAAAQDADTQDAASQDSRDQAAAPQLALEFGWQGDKDQKAAYRISQRNVVIEASAAEPQFYQWDIPLSEIHPRNPVRKREKLGVTDRTNPSEYIRLFNASTDSSADIQFDYVEVSAPVYDQWPPQSHAAIFIDSPNRDDEQAYAREIVSRFMRRAWRREVTETEVQLQLELFNRMRPVCKDFEQAMAETLAAVLSSPRFLYLVPAPGSPDKTQPTRHDFQLATRLAMFLWCSIPDDELLDLAAAGQLNRADVLARQTQRMLADPRHQRFSKHFVRQWLNMAPLEFVTIDRDTYPQFDDALMEAMQHEPVALFEQMLQHDHSVVDFLHADYAVVNERLAEHYGLSGVRGNEFRKVSLKPEDNRGGLLTQAGLLAMNSDGTDSHPLKRGIWLLESILNDPPPPPPPAVPEIDVADPEIMKLTLKQRMEDHRSQPACYSCHMKIDPWGVAFENFDALGNWRTRSQGKAIDASSLLYDEHELNGVDGVKRYLLANRQDQFVRGIVHKLTTYALGRPLTFGDRADVEQIAAELRQNGDGLQTLIQQVVASDLFQNTSHPSPDGQLHPDEGNDED
ncbi:DUF1592 domain-containing protein [Roseimaritima ulvae]|nr:DUF1592 domain-containing protein [Roseimaritima ulvae]